MRPTKSSKDFVPETFKVSGPAANPCIPHATTAFVPIFPRDNASHA